MGVYMRPFHTFLRQNKTDISLSVHQYQKRMTIWIFLSQIREAFKDSRFKFTYSFLGIKKDLGLRIVFEGHNGLDFNYRLVNVTISLVRPRYRFYLVTIVY